MSYALATPRDRLIATAAALKGGDWCAGEDFVHALELEPDKPVQCPCCTKLVTLCVKHYQLHEPGKPCATCKVDEAIEALP